MYDEERTLTLSHHAKIRIHLVHLELPTLKKLYNSNQMLYQNEFQPQSPV